MVSASVGLLVLSTEKMSGTCLLNTSRVIKIQNSLEFAWGNLTELGESDCEAKPAIINP